MTNLTIAEVDEISDEVLGFINISNQLLKSFKDLDNYYFDWQVTQENILETQLLIEFRKIRIKSIKNLELLNLPEVKSDVKKFADFLQTIEYNEKTSIIKADWHHFEWNRFPIKIDLFFEKGGNSTNDIINLISNVSSDPFDDMFFTNMKNANQVGGQSVLNMFDIPINFQLLDENAIKFMKDHSLSLAKGISTNISTRIKHELIEGMKNFERIDKLRSRINKVWNKPIDIKVPPRIDKFGKVVRSGYQYQLSAKNWANVVAKTETSRAFVEGRLEAYAQSGVVGTVEYVVAGDERVCAVCSAFEGKVFSLEEAAGIIPQHGRCRCGFIPKLKCGDLLKGYYLFTLSKGSANSKCYIAAKSKANSNITKLYKLKNKKKTTTWKKYAEDKNAKAKYGGLQENPEIFQKNIDKILGEGTNFDMFNAAYKTPGYKMELSITNVESNELRLFGQMIKNGDVKGNFKHIYKRVGNKLVVKEDFVANLEGKLFKEAYKKMLKSNKDLYSVLIDTTKLPKTKNVSVALTKTAKGAGKKAIPKMGYDWVDKKTMESIQKKWQVYISKNAKVYKPKNIKAKFNVDVSDFKHPWDYTLWEGKIKNTYIKGSDFLNSLGNYEGYLNLSKNNISSKIYDNFLGKSSNKIIGVKEKIKEEVFKPIKVSAKGKTGNQLFKEWYKNPKNKKLFNKNSKNVLKATMRNNDQYLDDWWDYWGNELQQLKTTMFDNISKNMNKAVEDIFNGWYKDSSSIGGTIVKEMSKRLRNSKVMFDKVYIDYNKAKEKLFYKKYNKAISQYKSRYKITEKQLESAFKVWSDFNSAVNKAIFGNKKGINVYRGVDNSWFKSNGLEFVENKKIRTKLNSASSWTTDYRTAEDFGDIILKTRINFDDTIGSYWNTIAKFSPLDEFEIIFMPVNGKITLFMVAV